MKRTGELNQKKFALSVLNKEEKTRKMPFQFSVLS